MASLTEQFLHNVMPSTDPTQTEIDEAVKAISLKFPNRDPFAFAEALFTKLQEMRQQSEVEQTASNFRQEIPAKSFDFHNFIKKMIAQAYYHMGYGYEHFLHFMLKRHASFHIDEELYIIFSKGMVLQIYRTLERMLIRSGRIIKLKHKNDVMKLNEWILSEGAPPLKEDHLLLKKLLARRYDMNDGSFCIEEANLLYNILQHKYDPFVTKDVEKMNECLNEIDIYSNSGQQELNFDSLINESDQFLQGPIEINLSFPPASTNLCNLPASDPNIHNELLHYESCNPDQLNFDMESPENFNF